MPIPKFALLTFETSDRQYQIVESRHPDQAALGEHGWAKKLLDNAPKDYCVHIGGLAFVLKTHEGWPLIQALLRGFQHPLDVISIALFEQELMGKFPSDTLAKLQQLGVAVYSTNSPQSPRA